jgi:hypothetical protein
LPEEEAMWWPVLRGSFTVMIASGAAMMPLTMMAVAGAWPIFFPIVAVQLSAAVAGAGWAMSKEAARQLEGMEPVVGHPLLESAPEATETSEPGQPAEQAAEPNRPVEEPVRAAVQPARSVEESPRVMTQPTRTIERPAAATAQPVRTAVTPRRMEVKSPAPAVATSEKVQCPKCKAFETERGSVIGLHCMVCGWRESRG